MIDSRKQHIISNIGGSDIRAVIKNIGKCIHSDCHIVVCAKQNVSDQSAADEVILSLDEIGNILDLERIFKDNKRILFETSFSENDTVNTENIVSYLSQNNIVSLHLDEDEHKEKANMSLKRKK